MFLKRFFVWVCLFVGTIAAKAAQPVVHIEFSASQVVVDVPGKNSMSFNDDVLQVETDSRTVMEFTDVVSLHYYDSDAELVATDLRRPRIHINSAINEVSVDGVKGLSIFLMNSGGGLISYSEETASNLQKVELPGMRGGYKLRIGKDEYKIIKK